MFSDHQKDTASMAQQRPNRNGLRSGPHLNISEDLESAHSNSNDQLDSSIDQPPPYEMASNTPTLGDMQPQPAKESLFSRFCKCLPGPLFTFNFALPRFTFNFTSNFTFARVSGCYFNLNLPYAIFAMVAICIWAWVVWGGSKTP